MAFTPARRPGLGRQLLVTLLSGTLIAGAMWLILSVVFTQLPPPSHADFLGGILTDYLPGSDVEIGTWYQSQIRPDVQPPDNYLPYIWIGAIGLMSLAGFLIWRRTFRHSAAASTLAYFGLQAFLCLSWAGAFYGLNSILTSVIISFFWTAMAMATYFAFLRFSKAAAFVFLPYLFWVFYLTYFSVSLLVLNL